LVTTQLDKIFLRQANSDRIHRIFHRRRICLWHEQDFPPSSYQIYPAFFFFHQGLFPPEADLPTA